MARRASRLQHASGISAELLADAHAWADLGRTDDTEQTARPAAPADLDLAGMLRLARQAAFLARTSMVSGSAAVDEALSAIGLAIAEAGDDQTPSEVDLVRVGERAVYEAARARARDGGWLAGDAQAGPAVAPRWRAWWLDWLHHLSRDRSDTVVEHVAVWQVLAGLRPHHRDTLVALATHGSIAAAAQAQGVQYKTMVARVQTARDAALQLWFSPEPAPPTPRRRRADTTDDQGACRQGHPRAQFGRHRLRSNRGWVCRECDRLRQVQRRADTSTVSPSTPWSPL